jgi:hypothetical protein
MVASSGGKALWKDVFLVLFILGMWLLYFLVAGEPAAAPFVYADF